MSGGYSLLFRMGESEANQLIAFKDNPQDYLLQEEGFRYYCSKLSEMISHYRSNRGKLAEIIDSDSFRKRYVPPEEIFYFLKCTLIKDFTQTGYINFSLFLLAYNIVLAYIGIHGGGPRDPYIVLQQTKAENVSYENYIDYANERFPNMVPFFWKKCTFGLKTFLDLYLLHDLFSIGTGIDCYKAHGGNVFNGFTMFEHDLGHYNETVLLNQDIYGKSLYVECYQKILENNYIEKQGCIALLFNMLHEIQLPSKGPEKPLNYLKNKIKEGIIRDFKSNRQPLHESLKQFIKSIGFESLNFSYEDTPSDEYEYESRIADNLYNLHELVKSHYDPTKKYLDEARYYIENKIMPFELINSNIIATDADTSQKYIYRSAKELIVLFLNDQWEMSKFNIVYDIIWDKFESLCSEIYETSNLRRIKEEEEEDEQFFNR